jgi:serine/threonine protein kinase/predicted Zn-dependent protease
MKCPVCHFENPENTNFCGQCAASLSGAEDHSALHTMTAETAKEELATGSTFAGRYQIIEELGRGGMGRVYKALDTEVNEKIALKLIKPEVAVDGKTIDRFRNELKLARKVRHKNVCQMYDLNRDRGNYFITMEYVSGDDLKGLIRKMSSFSAGQAVSIARQVCEGLAEAHRQGVVHRDLKPQNIMIDQEGVARIMDFGIARSVRGKGLTGAGVMIGTPDYMSPEQVEGKDTDPRSDIYSLGVILYEMATGRLPFEGETPFVVGVKHKSEVPRNPKELIPQLPDDLCRAILKCLEKDKEKRYQSARELGNDLLNIERGLPTTEKVIPQKRTLTSREITVKFTLKKAIVPVAAAIVLIAAALAFWLLRSPARKAVSSLPEKPSLAVMYFKNNTGQESLDHWRAMLANLLITDLTQSKYLKVLSEDRLLKILEDLNQAEAKTYSSDVLAQVAVRGGIHYVLQGAYARAGDEFRVNVTLQNIGSGELVGSESVAGTGEASIFVMVDELTRKIKADFKLTPGQIAGDIDREIGLVTTSSPEAYRYYCEGIAHDIKAENREAIKSMEKAVALDPGFASAYMVMSWCYGNLGYKAEQKKFEAKALELSDRLPDREKYNIQANHFINSERTYGRAREALEKLVEMYSDDIQGNNFLGILYARMGDYDKAVHYYEAAVESKTEDVTVHTNLAGAYEAQGRIEKSIELQKDFIRRIGDSAVIRRSLAYTYTLQGKYDLALEEASRAIALAPRSFQNFYRKGEIHLLRGEFDQAEAEFNKLLEHNEPAAQAWGNYYLHCLRLVQGRFKDAEDFVRTGLTHAMKHGQETWIGNWYYHLANTLNKQGRWDQAVEAADKAADLAAQEERYPNQRLCRMLQGLGYLGMGSPADAEKTASLIKDLADKSPDREAPWTYDYLRANIELEKKNYQRTIEFLKKGEALISANSGWRFAYADALGRAYRLSGNLDQAAVEYERAAGIPVYILWWADVHALSYYNLGLVYEQKGLKDRALKNYEKFLGLWKNADPDRPEVEYATRRIASLGSSKT